MAGAVSQRSLSLWLRRLGSAEPAEADKARRWLLAHPEASLPRLFDALDDEENEALRWRVIALLPLFGSSRCAAPLAALLHDPSEAIRSRAAAALARVASRRSVPALSRLIERETSHRVRWAATRALVRLAQTGRESALGPLLAIIGDPSASARIRVTAMAAIPWMTQGQHDASARRLLETLAADPEPRVASRARRLLSGSLGTRLEPWALGKLIDDLASRRLGIWQRAQTLLGRAGGTIVEPLVAAMGERPDDALFLSHCALTLKSLSPRQVARIGPLLAVEQPPAVLAVLVDVAAEAGSRPLLLRLAGMIETLAARYPPGSAPAVDAVRQRAHRALAEAGSRMAIADLRSLLEDRRLSITADLVEAATRIATRKDLPALLRAYLRSRGVTRLGLREAVLTVARRDKIRRTDRLLARLDERERRAAREILGAPLRASRGLPGRRSSLSSLAPGLER